MPMRIPSSTDTDSSSNATLFPKADPVANPISPATQSDIQAILQREQDRAMALLSSSPLLSSLFTSYANRAAAHESASRTPSPESEEWKSLLSCVTVLQEENVKLKSENREMFLKLEATGASQEAFRSQISSLKEVTGRQQDEIKTLRTELTEAKDMCGRLATDSNEEKSFSHARISDLEAQRTELRETVVEQQVKISKFERQLADNMPFPCPPSPSWRRASLDLSPTSPRSPVSRLQTPLPQGSKPASRVPSELIPPFHLTSMPSGRRISTPMPAPGEPHSPSQDGWSRRFSDNPL